MSVVPRSITEFRSNYRSLVSFLPRDAMQARPMPSCGVRPSVTFVNSVKTNRHIFKLFSPSGSHTILVFPYQTLWQYSDLTHPSNGGIECRWGTQNCDSKRIAGYRSMTAEVRTTTATIHHAVYRTDGHASPNLVYHTVEHGRPRRREENII